jgi:hypothetical protein
VDYRQRGKDPAVIGDLWQVTLKGSYVGQDMWNTFHMRQMAEFTDPGDQLLDQYGGTLLNAYKSIFPTIYTVKSVEVEWIVGPGPPLAGQERTLNVTGTRTGSLGEQCAPWLATLVRHKTGLKGRTRQGRSFYGALFESDVASEALLTGAGSHYALVQTWMENNFTQFAVPGNPSGFRWVIFSRKIAGDPPVEHATSYAYVNSYVVSSLLTSQRSRRTRTSA